MKQAAKNVHAFKTILSYFVLMDENIKYTKVVLPFFSATDFFENLKNARDPPAQNEHAHTHTHADIFRQQSIPHSSQSSFLNQEFKNY